MKATVTVNLPNGEEQNDLEYEGRDIRHIWDKVIQDWPNWESLVIVVANV